MSLEAPISMAAHAPFMSEGKPPQRSPPPPMASTNLRTSPAPVPSPSTLPPATAHAPTEISNSLRTDANAPQREPNAAGASSVPASATDAEGPLAPAPGSIAQDPDPDVDQQIIEALKSKDRLFVLKLGELMEGLVGERKMRHEVNPASTYQRLLVHRSAAYYKCSVENDSGLKTLTICTTVESRIPARRIAELVPPEAPAQPAFKIMRRSSRDRTKSKSGFSGGSAVGEDGDVSDAEPSEAGSLYSRGSTRKHKTIEEREAAYQEARSRIFMNFEEKEREKERDMSATSSTFSAVSGSTSASGIGGAANDLDNENVPAESEWSAPGGHDRRDGRRGNGSTSSRPWKTNGYQSGSRSARGSRGTSPHSFQYASIYDPPQAIPYEGTTAPGAPPPPGYMHYGYPYAPPQGQGPGQGYLAPYPPYYPQQYGYPAQPTHHSDPTTPAAPDLYPQHQMQPHMYPGGYMWPPMPAPPGHLSATSPPHHPGQPLPGHAPHAVTYSPTNYMQPHTGYGPYHPPHTGYYPPPSNGQMPPPLPPLQLSGQLVYPMDPSRSMNGSTHGGTPGHSRTSSRSSQGRRSAPPVRTAWSYGPGAAGGGFYGSDVVGPRLAGMRRMSGTSSVGSGSTGNRTPGGDDASSTVSSSTSSSSARTFTSTSTSSKHPLPARPDWAIGLRPEGSSRHHDSAPRGRNTGLERQSPATLQPTDFPPLSTAPPPPRAPVAGAWTNASSTRNILTPASANNGTSGGGQQHGNALVQYPHAGTEDKTFERPPPKGSAELFNPKGGLTPKKGQVYAPKEAKRGNTDDAVLMERMGALAVAPGPAPSA